MGSLLSICAGPPCRLCVVLWALQSFQDKQELRSVHFPKNISLPRSVCLLSYSRGCDLTLYSDSICSLTDAAIQIWTCLEECLGELVSSPLADEHFILMFICCHGNPSCVEIYFLDLGMAAEIQFSNHLLEKSIKYERKKDKPESLFPQKGTSHSAGH